MSEIIDWANLTPDARDRVVHALVMGHCPDEHCKGTWVPLDPEPDGLYCSGCGVTIGWHDTPRDEYHERLRPPAYSQNMSDAWKVVVVWLISSPPGPTTCQSRPSG